MKLKEEKTNKRPFDAVLFAATVPARQPTAKDKADAKEHKDDLVEPRNHADMQDLVSDL